MNEIEVRQTEKISQDLNFGILVLYSAVHRFML